ncbi:hypothetical protein Vadar_021347 [Vaccinium darrowii]|uniref:Uncharacterized protein n=1 Tax=Vaccinium darrowii TaxID=229202 RepID=A0ACB7ZE85_9ERIC|nr:hypothetical protein Vadar_021347 [Vaccinium darrowii]
MKTLDISYLSSKAQQLWSAWDIRVFVLLSLLIQCLLVSCASQKKRTNNGYLVTLISSVYYLADWVAPFTIGLISTRLGITTCDPGFGVINGDLVAFWSPFLLLHLGGPDNVTSLSADENDKWQQTLSKIMAQIVAIILINAKNLQHKSNPLYLASLAIFVAGGIKSVERVLSHLSASSISRSEKYLDVSLITRQAYAKIFELQLGIREAKLPTQVESVQLSPKKFEPSYLPRRNVELDFKMKNLKLDRESLLQFKEFLTSKNNPSYLPRGNVELDFKTENDKLDGESLFQFASFFYNNFKEFVTGNVNYSDKQRQSSREFFLRRSYPDAFRIAEIELRFLHEDLHTKAATRTPLMRFVTLALVTTASFSFYLHDKRRFSKIDICISYTLVFGALVLEIVSLLMVILSGRCVIVYNCFNSAKHIANAIVNIREWSESFCKCNLIYYCLGYRTPWFIRIIPGCIRSESLHEGMEFKITSTSGTVSKSLKDKIFKELCTRSKLAPDVETATMICSRRGDWALNQRSSHRQLKWSLGEVEYGHSLLLWHTANDLLLYNINASENDAWCSEQEFCKEISEYLLYLLLTKPAVMAPIAGNWVKNFWDTSLEAKRLFRKRSITNYEQACQAILSVDTNIEPVILKGDASASVLFDACRLAKQLKGFKEDKRWSLMSEVWMELLIYAAFHSEGTVHTENPSQGGELLTFVWLLMYHLGLGKQFQEEPLRTRYKLVVKK